MSGYTTGMINLNTNFPDIDLERDLIINEEEEVLGMGISELAANKFKINMTTIIISALIFLIILAWFDFIQTVFYAWTFPKSLEEAIPPDIKLWYAIFITIFILILVYLVYYCADGLKT